MSMAVVARAAPAKAMEVRAAREGQAVQWDTAVEALQRTPPVMAALEPPWAAAAAAPAP